MRLRGKIRVFSLPLQRIAGRCGGQSALLLPCAAAVKQCDADAQGTEIYSCDDCQGCPHALIKETSSSSLRNRRQPSRVTPVSSAFRDERKLAPFDLGGTGCAYSCCLWVFLFLGRPFHMQRHLFRHPMNGQVPFHAQFPIAPLLGTDAALRGKSEVGYFSRIEKIRRLFRCVMAGIEVLRLFTSMTTSMLDAAARILDQRACALHAGGKSTTHVGDHHVMNDEVCTGVGEISYEASSSGALLVPFFL